MSDHTMANWTRQRVVDWVTDHRGKPVLLRRKGTGLRVEGIFPGVEEVDACSADYFEAELRTNTPHLAVALTFHEDTVLVHVEGENPDTGGLCVSMSASVPYSELVLEELRAAAARPNKTGGTHDADAQEEPISSPYELLH